MAPFDFSALAAPLAETDACGPDLEQSDDPHFMLFMARAEGLLPASFFAFDRTKVDFDAEFDAIKKLLAVSRDLRLVSMLAKLLVLQGDLPAFVSCIGSIERLVAEQWDEVHPRADDGDFGLRMAVLQSLDDGAPVVLPLQHAPLVQSRRHGPISFRSYLLATGDLKPREEEPVLERSTVEAAFMEAELPSLVETRDRLKALHDSLAAIHAASLARVGHEQAVSFEKLPPLVERMLALVDGIVVKRDPTAAPKAEAAAAAAAPPSALDKVRNYIEGLVGRGNGVDAATPPDATGAAARAGGLASMADAAAALAGVAGYFERFEPSNPAVLLVRQAEQLMGKSFFEALRILLPAHAEQAAIHIGREQSFDLPVERLSALAGEAAPAWETEAPQRDGDEAPSDSDRPGGSANGGGARFDVRTRDHALALLLQVGDHYRAVEPSSPIPLLTERALTLAQCDFLSLLKDLLPEAPKPEEIVE